MSIHSLPAVKGLLENSLIEWPGKISIVIFLGGCNFRCPFCHSRQLVLGQESGESIPFQSVRDTVSARSGWIDGAVISGGEPTLASGLGQMLIELKGLGLLTRINTNGSRPRVLKELAGRGLIDSVAMDVKGPLDSRYSDLAGAEVDIDAIGETIDWLLEGGAGEVEFRTTVVPGMLGRDEIIDVARRLGKCADWVLQPFRPLDCLEQECNELPAMKVEQLQSMAEEAREFVRSCVVRGGAED